MRYFEKKRDNRMLDDALKRLKKEIYKDIESSCFKTTRFGNEQGMICIFWAENFINEYKELRHEKRKKELVMHIKNIQINRMIFYKCIFLNHTNTHENYYFLKNVIDSKLNTNYDFLDFKSIYNNYSKDEFNPVVHRYMLNSLLFLEMMAGFLTDIHAIELKLKNDFNQYRQLSLHHALDIVSEKVIYSKVFINEEYIPDGRVKRCVDLLFEKSSENQTFTTEQIVDFEKMFDNILSY